ncbi:MoaD/ThiS family protein [Nocardiopsis mangrovi]|uniref:MoaD/ThiS family protein n=1 Tax=Nocardiopsis mangrovi TaxID=1179818 RepID=A0ABV9DV84_9ACTN
MANGTIRYWAAAKEAAGTGEEQVEGSTLADVLESVLARRSGDDRLARVLARSSFLIDDRPVGTRPHSGVEFTDGCTVEVLPPFAGG